MYYGYNTGDHIAHYGVKGMHWRKGRRMPYDSWDDKTYFSYTTGQNYAAINRNTVNMSQQNGDYEGQRSPSELLGKTLVNALKEKSVKNMEAVAKSTEKERKRLFKSLGASSRTMQ